MSNCIRNMMNELINLDERSIVKAPDSRPINEDAFSSDADCTTVYWLGGGGFMVNARGTILFLDPTLETKAGQPLVCENGHKMLMPFPLNADGILRCDMVLYTHDDGDHAGPATSIKLARRGIPMLGSARVFETLVKYGMKPHAFTVCHAGEKHQIKQVTVRVLPADHPWQMIDEEKFGRVFYPEECVGYVVDTPDGSILFTGDTRLMKEHLHIPNIVVLPLDTSKCSFHLGRASAALLANKYPDAYLIPYHYGTFDVPEIPAQEGGDPQEVLCNVNDSEKRARILGPGHPFRFQGGKEVNPCNTSN